MRSDIDLGLDRAVVLVTGAKGNIGDAICDVFLREGSRVVATDLIEGSAREGLDLLTHDVTVELDWARVVAFIARKYGRLNILVNNAGIAPTERLDRMAADMFRRAFDVNVTGAFLGTKHAAALLAASGEGRVGGSSLINIASRAADRPAAFNACYCATKAAVAMLKRATAV